MKCSTAEVLCDHVSPLIMEGDHRGGEISALYVLQQLCKTPFASQFVSRGGHNLHKFLEEITEAIKAVCSLCTASFVILLFIESVDSTVS